MNAPTPFPQRHAPKIFDRKEEKERFRAGIADALAERSPDPVIWTGGPGYGKSTLRMEFEEIVQDMRLGDKAEGRQPVKVARATLVVDHDRSMVDHIISLRSQLAGQTGYKFITFDWAFVRWFRLAHPDGDIKQRHPNLFTGSGGAADDILGWLDSVGKELAGEALKDSLSLVPGLNLLKKYGDKFTSAAGDWLNRHRNGDELAYIESLGEEGLRNLLPDLLAENLEKGLGAERKKGRAAVVVMVDSAEKLVSSQEYKGTSDGWISRFRTYAPSAFITLFSRSEEHGKALSGEVRALEAMEAWQTHDYLEGFGMPNLCKEVIFAFSCGVPAAVRIGLDMYQEHLSGSIAEEGERMRILEHHLATEGYDMVFDQVAKDMSVASIREMIYLCCLKDLDDRRIRRFADAVFGSSTHVDTPRMLRMGMIRPTGIGSNYEVLGLWKGVFLRAEQHRHVRKDVEHRLAVAFMDACRGESARAEMESDEDSRRRAFELWGDLLRAVDFIASWEEADLHRWREVIQTLIAAGWAVSANDLMREVGAHIEKEHGGSRLQAGDKRWKAQLLACYGDCRGEVLEALGKFDMAYKCRHLALYARGRSGDLTFKDHCDYAIQGLRAGEDESFHENLAGALNVLVETIHHKMAKMSDLRNIPDIGETCYAQLMVGRAKDHCLSYRIGHDTYLSKTLSDAGRNPHHPGLAWWPQLHADLMNMAHHFRPQVTDPGYEEGLAALSIVRDCEQEMARAAQALLPFVFEVASFGGKVCEDIPALMTCLNASAKFLPEGEAKATLVQATEYMEQLLPKAEAFDEAKRRKLAKQMTGSRLADAGKKGDRRAVCLQTARMMNFLVEDGEFDLAATIGRSFEDTCSRNGYLKVMEPNHGVLAEVFGLLGLALHETGAPEGDIRKKLLFAFRQFEKDCEVSMSSKLSSEDDVKARLHWFKANIFGPTGFAMAMRQEGQVMVPDVVRQSEPHQEFQPSFG